MNVVAKIVFSIFLGDRNSFCNVQVGVLKPSVGFGVIQTYRQCRSKFSDLSTTETLIGSQLFTISRWTHFTMGLIENWYIHYTCIYVI